MLWLVTCSSVIVGGGGQCVIPYKWLFSRVVYFTNGPSFSISRILISRMAAGDHIFLILVKYFKILYFMN